METQIDSYGFSEKWSPEIARYNFTQVPNILLSCQGHLELTDGEILTLIHLLTFWFSNKSKVYPSITTLTKFSCNSFATVQRRLRTLEKKGFIKRRHRKGTSNTFDLMPCTKKLKKHEKVCANPPRKQQGPVSVVRSVDTSFLMSKEYETQRRRIVTNTENYTPSVDFEDWPWKN
jgi:hypothetical protein